MGRPLGSRVPRLTRPKFPPILKPRQGQTAVMSVGCFFVRIWVVAMYFCIYLLGESYREGGKVKKGTLANLTHWPEERRDPFRNCKVSCFSEGVSG